MQSDLEFSRRDLLKSTGALAFALATGGCEQILANRYVRRNVANLAANDPIIQTYGAAITKMKELPATDPRNWQKQAQIHLNHCPHSNWYLLPWHRAYILYFERICQNLTGNKSFALPYWNWTTNPAIPDVFWGNGNPLFDSNRFIAQGTPIGAEFVAHSVLEGILQEPNFQVFASSKASGPGQRDPGTKGPLESTPHDHVHTSIGGDMGTFLSPLDPVFWTHHCMIDFCWVDWNINRNNNNTNDTTWLSFSFTDFVDENGNPVTINPGITTFFPILLYTYEPSQIGNTIAQRKITSRKEGEAVKKFLQKGANADIPILKRFPLDQAVEVRVGRTATSSITVQSTAIRTAVEGQAVGRLLLTLSNVEPPAAADFFVRVFVNAGSTVSAETPITDPHYAGSFAFFLSDHGPGGSHGRAGYLIDLTQTLRRLSRASELSGDRMDLQFVAVPYPGRQVTASSFTIQRLELAVTR
jgi:tyrosinase